MGQNPGLHGERPGISHLSHGTAQQMITEGDDIVNNGFTYLPTAWSRVLFEKLTGLQLVKKFPTFYKN
jgi:hypothetical protein